MPIKKNFLALSTLFVLMISCQQKMDLALNDEGGGRISGHVNVNLIVQPIFGTYLKNLDLFSGIESPRDVLPTSISDPLTAYRYAQKNYKQNTSYDAKSGRYTVNVSFDFNDFQTLADPKIRSIFSVFSMGNTTTIRAEFNDRNRKKLEEHLPILPPMPSERDSKAEKEYLGGLAQAIVEYQEKIPAAQKEIASSKMIINITTSRPISEIIGGKVTNSERTQAAMEIPLTEIIFLKKDHVFSLTF